MSSEIDLIIESHFPNDKSIRWYAEHSLADKASYENVKRKILNSIAYWKTRIFNYGDGTKAAEEMNDFINELTTLLNYGKVEKYEE